ncbi:type II secretion system F family protein [Paenibacillus sp. J2TS4]|uniref:type II secretion system F family protein n=1 Tax=Paenibacillus sp. J2TS4 TaxID=2807194 RepID=UPI001BD0C050|nr:type II secretion system F family protein [Paenibacillus sp. J2TS4]
MNVQEEQKISLPYRLLMPVSMVLVNRTGLMEKMPAYITKLHLMIVACYGRKATMELTKLFIARMISTCILVLVFMLLLAAVTGEWLSVLLCGLLLIMLVPLMEVRGLNKRIRLHKRSMLIELPEFLNKLTLLVNAGETVQAAIIRCVESNRSETKSPLYQELAIMSNELKNNRSFARAMEELSKRCALPEISLFTTTVLLNYRRGGDDFVFALRELTRTLWEKRKALARTMGEEASSKLVFPMVITFGIVMIIVATPAILIMR